ncbi:hypothetical protein FACS1894178_8810 [Bacteroidia bacterium]|nr:hypothetical protein FACS1894178_8810 [Bacteroidia bacterium]
MQFQKIIFIIISLFLSDNVFSQHDLGNGFYVNTDSKYEILNTKEDYLMVKDDTILFYSTLKGGTKGLCYGLLKQNKIKKNPVKNMKKGDVIVNHITTSNNGRAKLIISDVYFSATYQDITAAKDTLSLKYLYDGHATFYDSLGRCLGIQRLDTGNIKYDKKEIIIPNDTYPLYSYDNKEVKQLPVAQFKYDYAIVYLYKDSYREGNVLYQNRIGKAHYQTENILIKNVQVIDVTIFFYPSINYINITNSKIKHQDNKIRIFLPKKYVNLKKNIIYRAKFNKFWVDYEKIEASEIEQTIIDVFNFMLQQM